MRYEKGELSDHQFGFDGDNLWQGRRDALFQSLSSNAKAKFVTRAVQFGSEPLFDKVLPEDTLAQQIKAAKQTLSSRRFSDVDVLIARRGARNIKCHRHN